MVGLEGLCGSVGTLGGERATGWGGRGGTGGAHTELVVLLGGEEVGAELPEEEGPELEGLLQVQLVQRPVHVERVDLHLEPPLIRGRGGGRHIRQFVAPASSQGPDSAKERRCRESDGKSKTR